jgi:hypothetical protein
MADRGSAWVAGLAGCCRKAGWTKFAGNYTVWSSKAALRSACAWRGATLGYSELDHWQSFTAFRSQGSRYASLALKKATVRLHASLAAASS